MFFFERRKTESLILAELLLSKTAFLPRVDSGRPEVDFVFSIAWDLTFSGLGHARFLMSVMEKPLSHTKIGGGRRGSLDAYG